MDVDMASPAGLQQVIEALCCQLDDTRQQLVRLKDLKAKKENLLHIGNRVLGEHCAISWPQNETYQGLEASIIETRACSTGWLITAEVQNLSEGLSDLQTALVVITDSIVCTVKQLKRSTTQVAQNNLLEASALVELHSVPRRADSSVCAAVYVLLLSQDGAPCAAVHAGHVNLDCKAWIHAIAQNVSPDSIDVGHSHRRPWPCGAQFSVTAGSSSRIDSIESCMESILVQQLGCLAGIDKTWQLGDTAEIKLSFEEEEEVFPKTLAQISIYSSTQQLVWMIQSVLELELQSMAAAQGLSLPPLKWTLVSPQPQQQQSKSVLITALDALIEEVDALNAWVDALKKQKAGTGEDSSAQQGLRKASIEAQKTAVEAMIHTDRKAAKALLNCNNTHKLN